MSPGVALSFQVFASVPGNGNCRGLLHVGRSLVDLASRRAQLRRQLRRAFHVYCALVCAAGTIGGIIGSLERENDRT